MGEDGFDRWKDGDLGFVSGEPASALSGSLGTNAGYGGFETPTVEGGRHLQAFLIVLPSDEAPFECPWFTTIQLKESVLSESLIGN